MYLTPLYLSLFHINDTYHLSSQFLLYIFPLLSTTSHHLSILLPLVVSWLLRSSPPLDDSLPPGHVAPFLRAFSTEEAWCTLSSASLSLVTHDLFSFYPYPDRAQSEYPYPAPGASFSRRWSFSRLLLLPFPSLAIHPHLSPLSPTSAFLFRSTLCPPPPLRSVPMPTPPLSSVQRRAHVLLLVFFRVRMCACGWESERAQPPTRRGRGELLRTMRYVHARARFFPHSSPGKRCTVPVRCNGNYVKGWRVAS